MKRLLLIVSCFISIRSLYGSEISRKVVQPHAAIQEVSQLSAKQATQKNIKAKSSSKAVVSKAISSQDQEVSQSDFEQALAKQEAPLPAVKLAPESAIELQKAILFKGVEEIGVKKNTFLCQGDQFSGSSCSQADIDNAVNFDLSGGKTLQFLDNFVYWLQEKDKRKEYVQKDLRYDGSALDSKLKQEGWGATNPYCLLVSTNPMLQKIVLPGQPAPKGFVKVIAQLLYSGNNLIELWSQDVAFIKEGQSLRLTLSNNVDERLPAMLAESKKATGVVNFLEELGLQSNTRDEQTYALATDSPRMVRIEAVSTQEQQSISTAKNSRTAVIATNKQLADQKNKEEQIKKPVQNQTEVSSAEQVDKVK